MTHFLNQVVKVTKVRQVESESLKKQFRESQEEITQLKQTIENQKEELHNTQVEVKYLQKIVSRFCFRLVCNNSYSLAACVASQVFRLRND